MKTWRLYVFQFTQNTNPTGGLYRKIYHFCEIYRDAPLISAGSISESTAKVLENLEEQVGEHEYILSSWSLDWYKETFRAEADSLDEFKKMIELEEQE